MASPDYTEHSILYFPHIEIRDSAWLKSALCIWDSVYRIVPSGYKPKDSDEVREAVDAGVVRDIRLSIDDLRDTREHFHDFLSSLSYIPDALDRPPRAERTLVHRDKLDERMIAELSDLVGALTRVGEWFDLPRGLADGYLLFLSDTVARRRSFPKLTDSESMFVAMQYFAFDGNVNEFVTPVGGEDMSAALVFRYLSPAGIDDHPLSDVLRFRKANTEGREAFRTAVEGLVEKLSKVEDQHHAVELIQSFTKNLQESKRITLAKLREHFSQPHSLLLCLGLPLGAVAFESLTKSSDNTLTIGSLGVTLVCALADVMKERREKWVPHEATYLAKLGEKFAGDSPFPTQMRRFDRMMEEFLND